MVDKAQVLVIGAGPVGLTLAIDLGRRGVRVVLIERNEQPLYRPKMERCNARSMEIFRRMGLAERIRAASRFHDVPMDIYLITRWAHPPLLHLQYPSIIEYRRRIAACRDGSLPLEPYQIISQYTLEPLLKSIAQQTPGVTVHSSCELVDFAQDADGVTAQTMDRHGKAQRFRADYMVGCDGGVSTVRKRLGIPLEGQGRLARQNQIFFRSRELFEAIPTGKGRHYYFLPDTVLVVQDDMQHFMVNTTTDIGDDAEQFLRQRIKLPVDIEVLNVNGWNMNLLVAERYSEGRIFMAGDAVHLVIPNGGLGMNTGIGDATDLSWKLAATLVGHCLRILHLDSDKAGFAIRGNANHEDIKRAVVVRKGRIAAPRRMLEVNSLHCRNVVGEQVAEELIRLLRVQLHPAKQIEAQRLAGEHVGPEAFLFDDCADFPIDRLAECQFGDVG